MAAPADSIAHFPRGLIQPQGSFRFSEDALLLAAFALDPVCPTEQSKFPPRYHTAPLWADLGTGCGVIALAALLLAGVPQSSHESHVSALSAPEVETKVFCYGLDYDEQLVQAAQDNARLLGLEQHFTAELADFASPEWPFLASKLRHHHGRASLVLANPPWRLRGTGREPATQARRNALFGDRDTFPLFVHAAASLLRPNGRFACVVGATRVADMLRALGDSAFNLLRIRFVHPSQTAPASWALIKARRTGHTPLQIDPPLILYGEDGHPTAASLEFCPFLR